MADVPAPGPRDAAPVNIESKAPGPLGIRVEGAPDGMLILQAGINEVSAKMLAILKDLPQVVALVNAGVLRVHRPVAI